MMQLTQGTKLQADKDAKGMRTKSWPLWETWKSIFGKDRATGGAAETLEIAANRLRSQMSGGSQVNENDYTPWFEDFPTEPITPLADFQELNDYSSGNNGKQTSTTKARPPKRKMLSRDADLMDFLANLHSETNSRLEMISARIGYEFDMGKARQEVFDKLGTVEGLTKRQRYELCNILGDKPQRLEVFIGMPADDRLEYLQLLIEDHSKEG